MTDAENWSREVHGPRSRSVPNRNSLQVQIGAKSTRQGQRKGVVEDAEELFNCLLVILGPCIDPKPKIIRLIF